MLVGCPIRKPADRLVCAHPRSLSQLVASFIASESLGIPRTPFSAFPAVTTEVMPARSLFYFFLLVVQHLAMLNYFSLFSSNMSKNVFQLTVTSDQ